MAAEEKGVIRQSSMGEIALPLKWYEYSAYLDLLDLERFCAAVRAQGAQDNATVQITRGFPVGPELFNLLRYTWTVEPPRKLHREDT